MRTRKIVNSIGCLLILLLQNETLVAKTDPNALTNRSIDTASLLERQRALNNKHREVLTQLATLAKGEANILAGAEHSEANEFNRQLNLLANAYETHLDALSKLKAIQDARQDFQPNAQAWAGFSDPPPYSLAFIQDQWQQVRLKDREIESARIELAMLEAMVESHRQAFQLSSQNSRKADERLESSSNPDSERNRWLKAFNDICKQQQEARLASLATEREARQENLSYLLEQRVLLQRKARLSSRTSPLLLAEKNLQIKQLEVSRQKLDDETAQTLEQYQKAQQRVQQMREQLLLAPKHMASDISDRINGIGSSPLQQALDTAMIEMDALASNLKVLRLLAQATEVNRQVWELQYSADNAKDLQIVDAVIQDIDIGLQRLTPWREYLGSDLATVRSRLDALEKRLSEWQGEYGNRDQELRKLQAYHRQETLLKRGVAEADQLEARLRSLSDLLQWRHDEADAMQRLRLSANQAIEMAESLSEFELLTIDDTIIADGREISGKRRVTVGKIVHMLAILSIGFWFIGRLARYSREKVVSWQSAQASSALLGLRLFSLTAVIAILVFALVSVHIPLTVFTLLGGTLAIGVGFGAQNLLNNFISGLILLMERSIKMGDIVEVEGILSRVSHIGSRCCQVQRFDGIDMLIPNSSFLEKTVTNWTLSDHCLRLSVLVGVAYGTPSTQAMALVKRAASEHPQVMTMPEPEVYLQDFAADALSLKLDFWIDLQIQPNRYRIMSDVRLRIEQLFAEANIVIPFQRRDIHLDVVKPLKVEMVKANSAG
ncbi:MAG: mechanosensitive ion channel [Methylicorpusculum sp.]|uniref:mechanosensitive ion channel domain-containing protein n=1 Tax=Methylicorpusculum sp. TaxID=2713644 RepID=UPI0027197A46|nr:mechanosensitive ion channel domain-containing protein [Methylicorpusculum sp.]MDO8940334.1 mechanosensitive ion channel [Methylicorpusculum sp.]MDP2203791.1 mechanosensitive ion channel [Methylicorpusculum sp.]